MNNLNCNNINCCELKTTKFIINTEKKYKSSYKAGIFIYSPNNNKILIVQSNGKLWGAPKGTVKKNESIIDCAIRETYEETGIKIDKNQLKISTQIKSKATYYYLEMNLKCIDEIYIPKEHIYNDVNSYALINMSCLDYFISNEIIKLNKHFIILLKRFLNYEIT
jgi:hypothetical protein